MFCTKTGKSQNGGILRTVLTAGAVTLFALFAITACRNEILPGSDLMGVGGKKVKVQFEMRDADPNQRTILPNVGVERFERYKLTLTNVNTGFVDTTEYRPDEWDPSFSLEVGDWLVEAEAFIANKVVAKGNAGPIHVGSGDSLKVTIDLMPLSDPNTKGTLVWYLESNAPNFKNGKMEIYNYDANGNHERTPFQTEDFILNKGYTMELPSGVYFAMATLEFENGAGTTNQGIETAVVHIYANLESDWSGSVEPSTSLLVKLLEGWDGNTWDFDPSLTPEHLAILDQQMGNDFNGFYTAPGDTPTAISQMAMSDIAKDWTIHSNNATPPPGAGEDFTLWSMLPLVDITNVLQSFPGKNDKAWEDQKFAGENLVEQFANDNAPNGTVFDFHFDKWDNSGVEVDIVSGATQRYNFKVPVPIFTLVEIEENDGGQVASVTGSTQVEQGGSVNYKGIPVGGWSGSQYVVDMGIRNITYPNGTSGGNITGNWVDVDGDGAVDHILDAYEVSVEDTVPINTRFDLWAKVEDQYNHIQESMVNVTVVESKAKLVVTAITGSLEVYADLGLQVALAGENLDVTNLDSGDPGKNSIDFATASSNVLPGSGNSATRLPVGVKPSGNFTITNAGSGSGSGVLNLKGLVELTTIMDRTISIEIGGVILDLDITINEKGTNSDPTSVVVKPVKGNSVSGKGGSIDFDVTASKFASPNGAFNFALPGSGPGPVITVTPALAGLTVAGNMTNDTKTGVGGGTLTLIIPENIAPEEFTLTVEFGDGKDKASGDTTFEVTEGGGMDNNNGLDSSNYPTLEWTGVGEANLYGYPEPESQVDYDNPPASGKFIWCQYVPAGNNSKIDLSDPAVKAVLASSANCHADIGFWVLIKQGSQVLGPVYIYDDGSSGNP